MIEPTWVRGVGASNSPKIHIMSGSRSLCGAMQFLKLKLQIVDPNQFGKHRQCSQCLRFYNEEFGEVRQTVLGKCVLCEQETRTRFCGGECRGIYYRIIHDPREIRARLFINHESGNIKEVKIGLSLTYPGGTKPLLIPLFPEIADLEFIAKQLIDPSCFQPSYGGIKLVNK